MKFFSRKKAETVQVPQDKDGRMFIRVLGDDWITLVKILRTDYAKHDIQIVDDVAAVGGEDKAVVKVFFEGTIEDYLNALLDLSVKYGIDRVKEDDVVSDETETETKTK